MIIAIVNHKGGTGKTTTTLNLGSALAAAGQRVLLADLDPQGSLTYSLGIDDTVPSVAEVLLGEIAMSEAIVSREAMDVLPAHTSLADVELSMAQADERFGYVKALLAEASGYDFILLDCAPSLSLLSVNALVAADALIVPMQMDVLALRGLTSMLETVEKVRTFNAGLQVLGVLSVMADSRKHIHQEVMALIRAEYPVPIFNQVIRTSVKAAEAPSFGTSVLHYAPESTTACDYRQLAGEVLSRVARLDPVV